MGNGTLSPEQFQGAMLEFKTNTTGWLAKLDGKIDALNESGCPIGEQNAKAIEALQKPADEGGGIMLRSGNRSISGSVVGVALIILILMMGYTFMSMAGALPETLSLQNEEDGQREEIATFLKHVKRTELGKEIFGEGNE